MNEVRKYSWGTKGNREVWIGGSLHISAVDGDIRLNEKNGGLNHNYL